MTEIAVDQTRSAPRSSFRYLDLIWYKAFAELRAEASKAYLGFLWWVVEPTLYMGAFYVIFALGLRMGGPDFVPFLLCGLVQWKGFNTSVSGGSNVVAASKGLISQVYFPKILLICVSSLVNFVRYLIITLLLIVFVLVYGIEPSINWLCMVPIAFSGAVLIAGVASVCACIVPFVPDFRLVITNGLMMMFFMSGIFFDVNNYPESTREWILLNPVSGWIANTRLVIMEGSQPNWGQVLYCLFVGLLFLLIGLAAFRKLDRRFAKSAIW